MSDEPNFSPRTDLPVIIAALGTAVAAVAAVRVDHNLATVATAVGAVVTSLLGYLKARRADANAQTVARIAADAVLGTNAKTVLVETVTAERAVWRRELRAAAAELATALRSSGARRPFDATRLDHLISEIRLRLNPAGREPAAEHSRHRLDFLVHEALDAIANRNHRARSSHAVLADRIERAASDLLKQEWKVSKDEAVTGRLGGSTAPTPEPSGVAA